MEPDELIPSNRPPSTGAVLRERVIGWVVWIGWRRLAVGVGIGTASVTGAWWLLRSSPPPVERSLPYASSGVRPASGPEADTAGAVPATSSAQPATAVVHVAGAVVRSGLVRVPVDARVADALAAAGGVVADADPDALNLAARVVDGARIYVPRRGEVVSVSAGAGAQVSADQPIDVNAADAAALDSLPGIGPSLARAIVAFRDAHGPFRSVDSLLDVPGIGTAKLEQFRALVRT